MITNNTPTMYTAAAASSVALSVVVILEWLLSLIHVSLPPDVESAMGFLIGHGVHWFITKDRPSPLEPVSKYTPVVEPTPTVPA